MRRINLERGYVNQITISLMRLFMEGSTLLTTYYVPVLLVDIVLVKLEMVKKAVED